ncbi:hypothetical protein M0R45_006601 [Rubus argutus]|uniref:Secreted protein n=1 Tax=Rubus argutus TaxID=59490 RepID=A0AAW1YQX1_RUBAR
MASLVLSSGIVPLSTAASSSGHHHREHPKPSCNCVPSLLPTLSAADTAGVSLIPAWLPELEHQALLSSESSLMPVTAEPRLQKHQPPPIQSKLHFHHHRCKSRSQPASAPRQTGNPWLPRAQLRTSSLQPLLGRISPWSNLSRPSVSVEEKETEERVTRKKRKKKKKRIK